MKKSNYRFDIDGIRAFAVLFVIINHFNKDLLPSGYLGVDIFFVISGYVITSSFKKIETNFLKFITHFYSKRIKRLIPVLLVYLVFAILCTLLVNPLPNFSIYTSIASLFGLSNIFLSLTSTDYFAESTFTNPFTQTWSLGVEQQFYFLFPIIVWISGFNRNIRKGNKYLIFLTILLAIPSLLSFIYFYPINESFAYFSILTRFWEIALGCITFLLITKQKNVTQNIEFNPSFFIGIFIIFLTLLPSNYGVLKTILITFSTSFLLINIKENSLVYNFLTLGFFKKIGLISYSLYLWHWGILALSRITIGIHWWTIPFQIGLIYLISDLSFNYIELPFRKRTKNNDFFVIIKGFILIISTSLVLLTTKIFNERFFIGNKNRDFIEIYSENFLWNRDNCKYGNKNLNPSSLVSFDQCWIKGKNQLLKTEEKKRIFTFGNSNNEMLVPAYLKLAESENYFINSVFTRGCKNNTLFKDRKDICNAHIKRYLKWLEKHSYPGDIFVLNNSINDFYYENDDSISYKDLKEYIKSLENIKNRLDLLGINMYVISGIPLLKSDPNICSQWYSKLNNDCKLEKLFREENTEIKTLYETISKNKKTLGIGFIDIFTSLNYQLKSSDAPWDYYYDPSHLSINGSFLTLPKLKDSLAP